MGLSSLPAPSEGVLCVLLVNTVLSVSIIKAIVRSILHVVGIGVSTWSPPATASWENPSDTFDFSLCPSDSFVEEFKRRTPTLRFGSLCNCKRQPDHDCSVCLTKFKPESEIIRLNCGHLFHKVCLEKWIDYWNVTCPLCRTAFVPEEKISSCVW